MFTIASIGSFLDFGENSENCLKNLIKPQMGTRINGTTSYHRQRSRAALL